MLVNEFGKFIAQTRYEDLPANVIATVKLRVLGTDFRIFETYKGYPHKRAAAAQIVLADGRRCSGYIANAKGEPEAPFSAAEIEAKFLTLMTDILPGGGARVHELVMGLENLADTAVLTAPLGARN